MRLILTLILAAGLVSSAGCFGKDDEGDTPPATSPTTGGTMTTPTGGTSPTGATPTSPTTGGNSTTPTKPAPKQLCAISFDFSQNTQPGAPPTNTATADCGSVTAGYTKATLVGNFTAATPAPVFLTNAITVSLVDATGASAASCNGPGPGQAAATPCAGEGAVTAGAYTLKFDGVGSARIDGVVMIS